MSIIIKELRTKTGLSQQKFADLFSIPVSTLRKWEQGESSAPRYVVDLIARSLPSSDSSLEKIEGKDGAIFYYDKAKQQVADVKGNRITISEDLTDVKKQNLKLYISDLFESFYEIQERFNRDCRYDKQEDIIWI
jgi:transcriptional regulator with XRE-family HTH domain